MQVIGFNFEKISAERKKQEKTEVKLEIKSNINIKAINQEKLELIKDKDVLKFNFEFSIDYTPNIADIKLDGFILLMLEKEKSKEIQKKWKNKKIEDSVRIPLFNLIMTKSNLKALQLEEELNLPTHIPMPRISPQQQANYTG